MAIHRIHGYMSPDAGMTDSEIQTAIDDWTSARTKWTGEGDDAQIMRRNTAEDESGVEYVFFTVCFEWDSASKDNTLQKFADKFKNKVAWFSAIYHECKGHDDPSVSHSCNWGEQWNWDDGNGIPQDVLDTIPDDGQTIVNA